MGSHLTLHFNEARRYANAENTILLGQQGDAIAGMQERSATASKSNSSDTQNQETNNKKFSDLLHTLQIIQDYMDRLAKSIAQMEDTFRQRDGEEWREKLALKILGEDDIPQRNSGESIEAYRDRLETLLINEMLNADGSIKDKYKNHPELSDYAQWAQKQYHLNAAQGYVRELENPDTKPEHRIEILNELTQRCSFEELALTSHEATLGNDVQHSVKEIVDSTTVEQSKTVHSADTANNFLKPIS